VQDGQGRLSGAHESGATVCADANPALTGFVAYAYSSMRDDELAFVNFDLEALARMEAGMLEPTA